LNRCGGRPGGGKAGLAVGGALNELASSGFFSRLERNASPRGEGGTGIGIAGCNGAASSGEL
jgi:hypothetical protein